MLTFYDRAFQLVICTSLLTLFSVPGAVSTLAQPTVDGDLSDADYQTVATKQNSNSGFGSAIDATEIVYFADDDNSTLYVGVKGQLDVSNFNGIGLMLNFQALSGTSAGTDLATSGGGHYTSSTVRADFEVDYMFAMNPGSGSSNVFYDGVERVGGSSTQFLGSSDQSGTSTTNENSDFFDTGSVTLAFNNGGGADQGFEMSIPYAQLGASGVSEVGAMEAFAFVVSNTGFYSDVTVPGDVTGGNLGNSPNFNTPSGGPYHGSKLFTTTGNSTSWDATSTWSNSTVPFDGADVELNDDVTLDTDATVHDLTISSGTFTASDGDGRTLTLKNGGTLTNNGTFSASDGILAASGNGTVTVPGSITLNNVTASTGLNFGSGNATVDGTFTINAGGFVNNNPPTYGNSSTLVYNNSTSLNIPFGRNLEWKTSAPGQPEDVTIQNNTFVNLGAFENTGETAAMSGDLTINSGSGLFMDFSSDDMTEALDVGGGVTLSGTLSLSDISGGDLEVEGDLTVNGSASLNTRGRAVIFDGSGTRSVDVSSGDSFDFFIIGSSATVELGTGVSISRDLEVDGTLNANNKQVTLDGSTAQSVKGTSSATFPVLEIDNSSGGVALNTGVSTSDELILTNGTLTTNGNLTLTSTSETSTAYISGSGSGTVSGGTVSDDREVTFERKLAFAPDTSHFRFLSAPTATLLDDEGGSNNPDNLLSNMWTQSETGTGGDAAGDPSVFVYNEAANLSNPPNTNLANGWEGIGQSNGNWGELNNLSALPGQSSDPIDPGRGFLAFMFADQDFDGTNEGFPLTLSATGSVQAQENNGSAINPPIDFTSGDGDGTSNNGWNLIANPFMAPIDWESIENDGSGLNGVDATIYVWNPEKDDYDEYVAASSGTGGTNNGQGRYIAPFQAFFVKANGNASDPDIGGIEASDKDIDQGPEFKSAGTSTPQVALQLRAEGDTTGKTTALRFTQDALTGKDAYDAFQLEPLGTSRTQVASQMAGTDALFAVQSRPVPAEADTIDLALDITEGGTYSLTASALENLPGDWQVILENTDSGARWDLGAGESATFSVEGTQSKSTAEDVSPAALLKDGPTVAKASTDNGLPSYRLFVGPAAALPVELASFDATTEGTKVQLSWQTASETNNAGFAIERRAQGGTWSQVGSRDGAGTTTEAQTYRFTDENLPFEAEQVRYRLRQEDLDGSTTLSDEVTVDLGAPSKARLHAPFPNPSAQQATVRYEVPQAATVEIAVYDVLGRRVETVVNGQVPAGREQRTLQTGTLAPGTYFVRMRLGDTVHTERLTVVR